MGIPLISLRSSVTLALTVACVILVTIWPGWFTAFATQQATYSDPVTVPGNLAVSSGTTQSTNISLRLGALRGSAPRASTGGRGASSDRPGEFAFGRLGLFLNGLGSFGDQDASGNEPGFDFHTAGLTLGADFNLTKNLILGTAFGYVNSKAEVDGSAGHSTTDGYSLSVYGSYYISDALYVDTIATYTWNGYDLERTEFNVGNVLGANETARGHPDGSQFALSLASGYNFYIGALTATPTLRVNYLHTYIDRYRERGTTAGNQRVNSQTIDSLTTDFGVQVSYAISMPWGVISPMARFEWEHEFENDSRIVTGRSTVNPGATFAAQTNDPDRDYFRLGAGLTATFARSTTGFFYYEAVVGRSNFTSHSFNAGIRFAFD